MKLMTFPNCWYTDALPGDGYVSADKAGLVSTSVYGVLTTPAGPHDLIWLRMSADGIRFAGCGHEDGHAWEWTGSAWANRGPFVAPRAVIYDKDNTLVVVRDTAWPGTGSQGWRYIDDAGELVEAYRTYASTTIDRFWEYTVHGDLMIGQGEGGVHALVDGRRVRLDYLFVDEHGNRSFGDAPQTLAINFNRQGDNCSIAFYVAHSPEHQTGCAMWMTRQEFDALPTFDLEPQEPDVPLPEPEPDPVPDTPESLLPTVERIWTKYGGQNRGAMLNEIAWEHRAKGWGLSRKTSGHFVESPVGKVASDILHHKPSDTIWDVFTDTGVIWAQATHHNDPNRPWVAPVAPADAPVPDPTDPTDPQPPGSSTGDLNAAADARAAALLAKILKPLEARIKALEDQPDSPAPQPFPTKVALKTVHGKYVAFEPDGKVVGDRESVGDWETVGIEVQD